VVTGRSVGRRVATARESERGIGPTRRRADLRAAPNARFPILSNRWRFSVGHGGVQGARDLSDVSASKVVSSRSVNRVGAQPFPSRDRSHIQRSVASIARDCNYVLTRQYWASSTTSPIDEFKCSATRRTVLLHSTATGAHDGLPHRRLTLPPERRECHPEPEQFSPEPALSLALASAAEQQHVLLPRCAHSSTHLRRPCDDTTDRPPPHRRAVRQTHKSWLYRRRRDSRTRRRSSSAGFHKLDLGSPSGASTTSRSGRTAVRGELAPTRSDF